MVTYKTTLEMMQARYGAENVTEDRPGVYSVRDPVSGIYRLEYHGTTREAEGVLPTGAFGKIPAETLRQREFEQARLREEFTYRQAAGVVGTRSIAEDQSMRQQIVEKSEKAKEQRVQDITPLFPIGYNPMTEASKESERQSLQERRDAVIAGVKETKVQDISPLWPAGPAGYSPVSQAQKSFEEKQEAKLYTPVISGKLPAQPGSIAAQYESARTVREAGFIKTTGAILSSSELFAKGVETGLRGIGEKAGLKDTGYSQSTQELIEMTADRLKNKPTPTQLFLESPLTAAIPIGVGAKVGTAVIKGGLMRVSAGLAAKTAPKASFLFGVGTQGLKTGTVKAATYSGIAARIAEAGAKAVEPAVAVGSLGVVGYDIATSKDVYEAGGKLAVYGAMTPGALVGWRGAEKVLSIKPPKIPVPPRKTIVSAQKSIQKAASRLPVSTFKEYFPTAEHLTETQAVFRELLPSRTSAQESLRILKEFFPSKSIIPETKSIISPYLPTIVGIRESTAILRENLPYIGKLEESKKTFGELLPRKEHIIEIKTIAEDFTQSKKTLSNAKQIQKDINKKLKKTQASVKKGIYQEIYLPRKTAFIESKTMLREYFPTMRGVRESQKIIKEIPQMEFRPVETLRTIGKYPVMERPTGFEIIPGRYRNILTLTEKDLIKSRLKTAKERAAKGDAFAKKDIKKYEKQLEDIEQAEKAGAKPEITTMASISQAPIGAARPKITKLKHGESAIKTRSGQSLIVKQITETRQAVKQRYAPQVQVQRQGQIQIQKQKQIQVQKLSQVQVQKPIQKQRLVYTQIPKQMQTGTQMYIQKQAMRQIQRQSQSLKQIQKQTQKQIQRQRQIYAQVPIQTQKQGQVYAQVQLQAQVQEQKQVQLYTTKQIQKQITQLRQVPVTKTILLPRLGSQVQRRRRYKGRKYRPYVERARIATPKQVFRGIRAPRSAARGKSPAEDMLKKLRKKLKR